jgi:hypothetical protein
VGGADGGGGIAGLGGLFQFVEYLDDDNDRRRWHRVFDVVGEFALDHVGGIG